MEEKELKQLKMKAKMIRKMVLESLGQLGFGHIGGSLSIVETLTILYYKHLNIDPSNPKKPDRDMLVMSKGHAGPTLYSILADKGYFPKAWMNTINRGGTKLPSHCDMNLTPGIDMTTGSLGQGFSAAIGMALANRLDNLKNTVYAIIGDGESNEGQVWEAAMAANQFKLNNLIAFTDYNKMGLDGYIDEIMNLEDLTAKWVSFGWFVLRVNGHSFPELDRAINRAKEEKHQPSMIILDTIKGKGAFFAEGKVESHHMAFDYDTAKEAIAKLDDYGDECLI